MCFLQEMLSFTNQELARLQLISSQLEPYKETVSAFLNSKEKPSRHKASKQATKKSSLTSAVAGLQATCLWNIGNPQMSSHSMTSPYAPAILLLHLSEKLSIVEGLPL